MVGSPNQAGPVPVALYRKGAIDPGEIDVLIIAGASAAARDDFAAGEALLQRAIERSQQIGYQAGLSAALDHLARQVYLRRGQFDLALTTAARVVQLGPTDQHAPVWLLRAWVYQITGERQRAREALETLRGFEALDARSGAMIVYLLAELTLDETDLEAARPLLHQALLAAETVGVPLLRVAVRMAFSRWHRLRDDGSALEWADDAVAMARRLRSEFLLGQALIEHGQVAWAADEVSLAETDLKGALALLDRLGVVYDAARAALLLSALYQRVQHAEAQAAWRDAVRRIATHGYGFLLERERAHTLALLAAQRRDEDPQARAMADRLIRELMKVLPLPLYIIGLGTFSVRQGHRCIPLDDWEQRKAGELFRFLLVQPHYCASREVICEALWPGKRGAAAERLLQQATWVLRRVLEPDLPERGCSRYLKVANQHVALYLPPGSTVDFVRFEEAIQRAFDASRAELEQSLSMYGELFPHDRYADWAAGPCQRLADLYVRGLLRLAGLHLEGQRPELALGCCDRLLSHDPWHEEAVKLAMQACLALGDRAGALRRYEALKRALRRNLHLDPRADLRDLAGEIRRM